MSTSSLTQQRLTHGFMAFAAMAATAAVASPAQAGTFDFGTDGIRFDKDTIGTFNFVESHGKFQSTFGVYEVDTDGEVGTFTKLFEEVKPSDSGSANDWIGTCGKTVLTCSNSFTFLKGVNYTFGLQSLSGNIVRPTVYSTTALNKGLFGTQVYFSNDLNAEPAKGTVVGSSSADPFASSAAVGFEDTVTKKNKGTQPLKVGQALVDYNDFKVTVEAKSAETESVPEPGMTAALGAVAVAGAMALRRRTAGGRVERFNVE
ncbi:PEP-CTERM sorting domain-containing protein [Leptolyngbya sp. FACHB-261]|uniref:PEP-CTERM sorting domain-containing protein n=1 Tax=Leptolyngbya sp. FACHB-261 TaxID=2692806 RepID=UPI001683D10E|nr:PEP-CTERM sorting domain-containing protein [Leptolyngbya sp. FACHB-261]MBD2104408.1 PEP-CTERM sorting domain-containing protein [Leptolyngbya sp. FACHB-261]